MKVIIPVLIFLISLLFAPLIIPDPPVSDDITKLPASIQSWHKIGGYMKIGQYELFFIHKECKLKVNAPTFVIIHGYPSSSFEYHKVIEELLERGNVFVHDHLGFGFSDKPSKNFTYSIAEAADNCLTAWQQAGIKNAHLVAHDMGDTILTEILARRYRGLLPNYFDDFFLSVTFTNGGMKYSLINFRIGQTLLHNVYLGPYFSKVGNRLGISRAFARKQLYSIWGPDVAVEERNRDVDAIIELIGFKGGAAISDKTIYYLWDRAHFEFRWFEALAHLDLDVRFIWGDSDAVSPTTIPEFFASFVPTAQVSTMKKAGHFIMLEQPQEWVKRICEII